MFNEQRMLISIPNFLLHKKGSTLNLPKKNFYLNRKMLLKHMTMTLSLKRKKKKEKRKMLLRDLKNFFFWMTEIARAKLGMSIYYY